MGVTMKYTSTRFSSEKFDFVYATKLAFCQTALFRVLNRLNVYEFIVQIYVYLYEDCSIQATINNKNNVCMTLVE